MIKTIRKILLKINCIEQAVIAHQDQQAERKAQQATKEYHENWARLMRSSNTARDEDKPVERAVEVRTDYLDTRMVGQRSVTPVFIDSVNWGGM